MTAFSTASFGRASAAWAWLLLALLLPPAAAAEGIQVRAAELVPQEDGYLLNAEFDIALSPTLEEALNKGVSLYFNVDFELIRPRWYWFDEKVVSRELQFKLAYNVLSRQYRLSFGPLFQNYSTLSEAVGVLARLRNRQVLDKGLVQRGSAYTAALRMRLDTSLLPKPFQINAVISKDWNLGSEWYRWNFLP